MEFNDGSGFETGEIDTTIAVGLREGSSLAGPINQALATISENERNQLMESMVILNERGEASGFWAGVVGIWDDYGSRFLVGARNTLIIALVSTVIGSIIGLLIAIYRSFPADRKGKPLRQVLYRIFEFLIVAYVEIFRGTPMMVQAMMIFYGSKLFFDIDLSSMMAAFIVVSVNTVLI